MIREESERAPEMIQRWEDQTFGLLIIILPIDIIWVHEIEEVSPKWIKDYVFSDRQLSRPLKNQMSRSVIDIDEFL